MKHDDEYPDENYDNVSRALTDHCWVSIKKKVRCQLADQQVACTQPGCIIIVVERTSASFNIKALAEQYAASPEGLFFSFLFYSSLYSVNLRLSLVLN